MDLMLHKYGTSLDEFQRGCVDAYRSVTTNFVDRRSNLVKLGTFSYGLAHFLQDVRAAYGKYHLQPHLVVRNVTADVRAVRVEAGHVDSAQSRTFWGLDKEEATHKFVTGIIGPEATLHLETNGRIPRRLAVDVAFSVEEAWALRPEAQPEAAEEAPQNLQFAKQQHLFTFETNIGTQDFAWQIRNINDCICAK
jgi:hypothetical protein